MEPKPLKNNHSLMKFAREALSLLGEKREPEVYLIDGRTIRKLNRKFRGIDRQTDVLAFPYPEDFPVQKGKPRPLGDIYLFSAYIKKNNETEEYLLAHGLLHLLGFNHDKKSDRIKMEKLEEMVLKKTGRARHIDQ